MNQHDVKGHAQLQALMQAPLLVGENLTSLTLFRDFFEQRALRLAQPDVTRLGGITRWLDVAALARANSIRVVPACWDTMQVSVHLAAATPEVHLMEHLDWTLDIFEERLRHRGRLAPRADRTRRRAARFARTSSSSTASATPDGTLRRSVSAVVDAHAATPGRRRRAAVPTASITRRMPAPVAQRATAGPRPRPRPARLPEPAKRRRTASGPGHRPPRCALVATQPSRRARAAGRSLTEPSNGQKSCATSQLIAIDSGGSVRSGPAPDWRRDRCAGPAPAAQTETRIRGALRTRASAVGVDELSRRLGGRCAKLVRRDPDRARPTTGRATRGTCDRATDGFRGHRDGWPHPRPRRCPFPTVGPPPTLGVPRHPCLQVSGRDLRCRTVLPRRPWEDPMQRRLACPARRRGRDRRRVPGRHREPGADGRAQRGPLDRRLDRRADARPRPRPRRRPPPPPPRPPRAQPRRPPRAPPPAHRPAPTRPT